MALQNNLFWPPQPAKMEESAIDTDRRDYARLQAVRGSVLLPCAN
jgi:hypothetical protein